MHFRGSGDYKVFLLDKFTRLRPGVLMQYLLRDIPNTEEKRKGAPLYRSFESKIIRDNNNKNKTMSLGRFLIQRKHCISAEVYILRI